ncbi:MAG: hypothetical protein M1832_002760 [Thelocarpon impressellum]|nr:MAG: hypothetical protein M1832_002760 [Thelocarpon impressellum]
MESQAQRLPGSQSHAHARAHAPSPAYTPPASQPHRPDLDDSPSASPRQRGARPPPSQHAPALYKFPAVPSAAVGSAPDTDMSVTADEESVTSAEDDRRRAASVVSMDDPDVRIAAEALGDLRADFIQSPSQRPTTVDGSAPTDGSRPGSQQPEPLLSLLTTSHPLLSTAITGSLSAYSTSKSYSPRFKSGAEFVERHIGTPVASTVNTVGRRTGVEGGVRWWLGSRRSSAVHQADDDEAEGANKRRKISDAPDGSGARHGSMDIERGLYTALHEYGQRRPSQLSFESLPAYDDNRSPNYEAQSALVTTAADADDQQAAASTWQSRLMLSTSGLGVAMSDESLRSLKYCLTWLRWANVHLGKVIVALKNVVDEWDQSQREAVPSAEPMSPTAKITDGEKEQSSLIVRAAENEAALSRRIQALKGDVLQTLKKVVDIVSKYAGGALPENARLLVRRHLTSLPQRFRLASSAPAATDSLATSETVSSANRVMVLAREGLDMMSQVSGVLDGTIVSAEDWCDRLGRRKRGEPEEGDDKVNGEFQDDRPVDVNGSGHTADEKARPMTTEAAAEVGAGDERMVET